MEKLIAFGFKIFSKNKAILLPCRGCIVKKKSELSKSVRISCIPVLASKKQQHRSDRVDFIKANKFLRHSIIYNIQRMRKIKAHLVKPPGAVRECWARGGSNYHQSLTPWETNCSYLTIEKTVTDLIKINDHVQNVAQWVMAQP